MIQQIDLKKLFLGKAGFKRVFFDIYITPNVSNVSLALNILVEVSSIS